MPQFLDPLSDFLWRVALKKAVARGVQVLVSILLAQGVKDAGITLDQDMMVLAIMVKLEVLRNYLKVKRGWRSLP